MKYLTIFLFISLFFVSCSRGSSEIAPPEIHYGEDVCAECNMIISDPRYACGFLYEIDAKQYRSVIFDDIGDMLIYVKTHPEHKIMAWYVHDFTSEAWLDATQAHYVLSPEIHTPMAHGIAAHAEQPAAQAMAQELHGEILNWAALQARYQVK